MGGLFGVETRGAFMVFPPRYQGIDPGIHGLELVACPCPGQLSCDFDKLNAHTAATIKIDLDVFMFFGFCYYSTKLKHLRISFRVSL